MIHLELKLNGEELKKKLNIKNGEPGSNGSPDTPETVVSKVNASKEKINKNQIQGLEEIERQATSLPQTTTFINGKRAKNIAFTGATVTHTGDTATVAITSGSGDVVGPSSATADNVALFNGTTGKIIKDSGQPFTKTGIGLSNVDNTSDASKPVSTATQTALNLKENTITAGTTAQYWRGDKSFQTLDKTAVGLANVDNTSDANKPVSSATQTALNLKENSITAGTTTQYWRGDKTFQSKDRLLFTNFVNAPNDTTLETDLYNNTIAAATFVTNGDLIVSKTTGSFAGSGTATRQLRAYFAATLIFDSGALSISGNSDWRLEAVVIRVSNTVVRCSVALNTGGASTSVYTKFTEITALNLTTTGYPIKSTGQAAGVGAASNDITAKMGFIEYKNNI